MTQEEIKQMKEDELLYHYQVYVLEVFDDENSRILRLLEDEMKNRSIIPLRFVKHRRGVK